MGKMQHTVVVVVVVRIPMIFTGLVFRLLSLSFPHIPEPVSVRARERARRMITRGLN